MHHINLNIWKNGAKRAPHKPLLLLYALGRWSNGQREFPWREVKKNVGGLIDQFGGSAKPEASNPFVRLQRDGEGMLWKVEGELVIGASGNPSVSALNSNNNVGRFTREFESQLQDAKFFNALVNELLVEHFSETQFEDLLEACGLSQAEEVSYKRRKRNPDFRQSVLDAYHHKCAVCDYDVSFRTKIIGVEAAHLQWHNSQGPDIVQNGIALCAIHHKLLDYGAIGFNDQLELISAKGLRGDQAQRDYFVHRHEGRQISLPRDGMEEPGVSYVSWQRREIFKG